ncbi:MAG TPA: carboxypeptidase-like regulatory domain-containing protein, partial [Chthonomonas sp.]|uniref:carboxypeptidase-like regulatory domain-containing protein n=1 Tax=Chthonomonas sp. TaxID=2282153 RepID=UPI002B4B7ED4
LPQDVTFQLSPDIAPPPGWTALPGQLSLQGAWTTPPPPGPISTPSQVFFDANGKATLQLYKGWKYEVSGAYVGYEACKNDFDTPVSGVISVPCRLQALLILKVYTTSPDSGAIPANITITDAKSNTVLTGTSQSDGKGNYVFSNPQVHPISPGVYTVKATSLGPPRNPGVATITVERGVEQDVTVQLGPIQSPHPPNP